MDYITTLPPPPIKHTQNIYWSTDRYMYNCIIGLASAVVVIWSCLVIPNELHSINRCTKDTTQNIGRNQIQNKKNTHQGNN